MLKKNKSKKIKLDKELAALVKMKDKDINTSDIPELKDWSKVIVGKFYRPKQKP
jgi:hypothetical protein